MALEGYKRVAAAAVFGRKRIQERNKQQDSQEQEPGRAEPSLNSDRENAAVDQSPQGNAQLSTKILRKKERHRRKHVYQRQREKEKKRSTGQQKKEHGLKDAENTEKQRLKKEEKIRKKKLEKRRRHQERKRLIEEPEQKPDGTAKDHTALQEGVAPGSCDFHGASGAIAEAEGGAKYDLAVKFGCVNRKDGMSESIHDTFFKAAFEDGHAPQTTGNISSIGDTDALQEIQAPLHRSLPSEYQPRTPTHSPPIDGPMTPTRPVKMPDVLLVTPSKRCPSPQLEFIVSPKSPAIHQAAANMLVTLKSRNERLNSQIAGFNTHLLALQRNQSSPSKAKPTESAAKAKVLRKITNAMEKHSNQVFMMEFALRDLLDEGDEDLPESLRKTQAEFADLVRVYEGKMRKLMVKLSPEAAEKTLKEVGDRSDGVV
jgi:hypothetical protein